MAIDNRISYDTGMETAEIRSFSPNQTQAELEAITRILACDASVNPKGFPVVDRAGFHAMRDDLSLLFCGGLGLLAGLDKLQHHPSVDEKSQYALRVLGTVVRTANVTAPSDLWLMRAILEAHREIGVQDAIQKSPGISTSELAAKLGVDKEYLQDDLAFLGSRLFLERAGDQNRYSNAPQVTDVLQNLKPLPKFSSMNFVPELVNCLRGQGELSNELKEFFDEKAPKEGDRQGWAPTLRELEIGFRVVPVVLALRILGDSQSAKPGHKLGAKVPGSVSRWLEAAGYFDPEFLVTELGARVLQRGPGPFGIIHAYHSYLTNHQQLLRGDRDGLWVARGENVAASQDANSKTFTEANNSLDRFCSDTGFSFNVFIEHAVGQGEATRQRFARDGDKQQSYFGADLEQAAIEKAKEAQRRKELPAGMAFVSGADIGKPNTLLAGLKDAKVSSLGAVMMVGNGFHEVRSQTNESMVEVFRQYREAGLLLIFTEESGLLDEDLIETAWNTYHAGFRYVHAISGQGLRPAFERDDSTNVRFGWAKCATLAGYHVLDDYCFRSRKIYPHPRKDGYNPAISVTYFCVPKVIFSQYCEK